jgi:tripartite-type tricarboxylate transporter receptor subunit TctC
MAQTLSTSLGQAFVVENRPGAGGLIALDLLAKSAPDGYTIAVGSAGPLTVSPSIYKERLFDPLSQLEPVVLFANTPGTILVRQDLPASSVRELIALSKASQGKLNMASAGSGSVLHLIGEYFQEANGIKWVHIPYKGSAPALVDLAAGRADVMIDSPPSAAPFVKSGKIRVLAVTAQRRSNLMPGAPTLEEQGFPGYDMGSWMGIVAPKGTPPEVVARLNAVLVKSLSSPEMLERLANIGAEPEGGSPLQFGQRIQVELRRWADLIARAGIKAD